MKNSSKIISLILVLTLFLSGCASVFNAKINSEYTESIASQQDTESVVSTENIALPCDSYYCDGKHYTDVITLFVNAGFTNVIAVAQNADNSKETRVNGSVIAVSVNNNIIFGEGALCSSNIEIKVYYVISQITESVSSAESSASETTSSEQATTTSQPTTESSINTEELVWIPASGTKYHSKSTCSGMKNPTQVTKEEAEAQGYEPCKRCN